MVSIIRLPVNELDADRAVLLRAAMAIRSGGVVAMPTDTLYGLAADPFNSKAVDRIFLIKGRAAEKGLPLIAADIAQITGSLGELTAIGLRLARRFWPGPLTLLIPAPKRLALQVTGGTGRIGVRVPDHAISRALCAMCDRPLTATSANISGQAATSDPDEVAEALGQSIDLLLDSGRTRGGAPSTIIDVAGDSPRLVRAGRIPWEEIEACLEGA
jgi:L-threonylcarbamoyladenylate synthase